MLSLAYTPASLVLKLVSSCLYCSTFTDDIYLGGQLLPGVRVLHFSCVFHVVSEAIDTPPREYRRVRETTGNRIGYSSCVLRCSSFGVTDHEGLSLLYYEKINNVSNYTQAISGREFDATDVVVVKFFQT